MSGGGLDPLELEMLFDQVKLWKASSQVCVSGTVTNGRGGQVGVKGSTIEVTVSLSSLSPSLLNIIVSSSSEEVLDKESGTGSGRQDRSLLSQVWSTYSLYG